MVAQEMKTAPSGSVSATPEGPNRLASVWAALARARRPEADAVAAAGRLVIDSNHATDARPYP